MDTLGKIVRKARESRKETVKKLARRAGVSEGFARHIEASRHVPISERVIGKIAEAYRIPRAKLEKAAQSRNRVGRAYYREYRRKAA